MATNAEVLAALNALTEAVARLAPTPVTAAPAQAAAAAPVYDAGRVRCTIHAATACTREFAPTSAGISSHEACAGACPLKADGTKRSHKHA